MNPRNIVVERPNNKIVGEYASEEQATIVAASCQCRKHAPEIYFGTYTKQQTENLKTLGHLGE